MISQLKVNEIIKQSGSSITIGEAGDTVSGPFTNTPAFDVRLGSDQTMSDNTATKANFDTEDLDTASAYDTSTYRFTVPSNQAGTYFIYAFTNGGGSGGNTSLSHDIYLYKNGSQITAARGQTRHDTNRTYIDVNTITLSVNLAAGDYLEVYARADISSGSATLHSIGSRFGGYRLIGA